MGKASTPRRRFDDPDRTARARIRDAAIARFADEGVAAANLKDIAKDAGVSTPLVLHHFGSKDGLRAACDEYIAKVVKEQKQAGMAAGMGLDPFQAVREAYDGTPLLRYLARTIPDGSPHVAELLDEMIDDAVGYLAEGVQNGILEPAEDERERAIVLTLWQLGALVLHEHARRLLGIDLTSDRADDALKWARVNVDILAKGVLTEDFYAKWRDDLADAAGDRAISETPRPTEDRE